MNSKLLFVALVMVFTSMGIAGCADQEAEENKRKAQLYDSQAEKQAKLEKCFQDSRDTTFEILKLNTKEHPECYKGNIAPNVALQCDEMAKNVIKQEKDEEGRCMKLYK